MKLSTLKKKAQSFTKFRGHRMKWGQVFGRTNGPKGQNAICRDCPCSVSIIECTEPNKVLIGGNALALNCKEMSDRSEYKKATNIEL